MPGKLTILGVVAVVAFGALNLFERSASAEIQTFTPLGAEIVASRTCYMGAAPTSLAVCGAGSSSTNIDSTANPAGSALNVFGVIRLDAGARLSLPITYTHPAFFGADPAISTVTGEVTSATDLLCNSGAPDILATSSSTPGSWPGATWDGFDFTRIADSNDALPAGDAYVDAIRPQPPTFTFASSDRATLTHLWLAGAFLAPLATPASLNVAAYTSPYGGGYRSAVALLGGNPASPPSDDYLCIDSPQHSVTTTNASAGLVVPPNGDYVRFSVFTSELDVFDGSIARILDADCVHVSAGGIGAPACDMTDADGDLVPAAVEAANGSSSATADGDGDGSNDYAELAQFTNATVADTDADGSMDRADTGADENAPTTAATIDDTTADDNCPAHANAAQLNEDFEASLAGPGPGSQTDGTNPDQDPYGDACDTDDDNDNLSDLTEATMTIVAWSGNTDPGGADAPDTTVCKGPAVGSAPLVVMNPLDSDSDDDIYLDGIECQMSSRPDLADPAIGSCSTGPVDPDGCALRKPSLAGGDLDGPAPLGDYLYHPTSAGGHNTVEAFYRTRQINLDGSTQTHDTDGDGFNGENDKDADNDRIADGPEVWSYGTSPANPDTDGDGCGDGREAADVNGNRVVNASDLALIASPATYGAGPGGPYRAANGTITAQIWKKNADINRNGVVNVQDLGFVALLIGACNSPSNQQGRVITNQLAP